MVDCTVGTNLSQKTSRWIIQRITTEFDRQDVLSERLTVANVLEVKKKKKWPDLWLSVVSLCLLLVSHYIT
jgi:hypothetical protein